MSQMIERVARALASDAEIPWDELDRKYPGEEMQNQFRSQARAVIEAMREPTKEMVDRGDLWEDIPKYSANVWDAMIDAALTSPDTSLPR